MKHFVLVVVLLIVVNFSTPAEVLQLPGLTKPQRIRADENNIYIVERFLKQFYHQMLKPITFPTRFPAIRDLRVSDEKIYVITYKKEKTVTECIIFDTKGKFLKQVWLPLEEVNILNHYPFDIKNGKLYHLVENDDEVWQLHISKI